MNRDINRAALALTEGLFSHSVDMTLWVLAYMGEMSIPFGASSQLWRAGIAADRFLYEINYNVIKNAIITAKKRGYVKTTKRRAWPQITEEGKRRLFSIIPRYDEKRVWDGRMHIITYDIPEEHRNDRHLLRDYLRRIGCGRLQDSVWITPYNPIDTIRAFIEEHGLFGNVIVSDMGQDGAIGEEDLRAMIVRIYGLKALNTRYEDFLKDSEGQKLDQLSVVRFLSILKDDPQLPFSLLPEWWKGEEAYKRINSNFITLSKQILPGLK